MKKYCLNKNIVENGYYEVHLDICEYLPPIENQINLGFHDSALTAIAEAKKLYPEVSDKIQGCQYCISTFSESINIKF